MENRVVQIAARILELRQIFNKTQEEMAIITGVSLDEYKACESGNSDFSFTFVHNCAKAFGVDITELITGEDAKLSTFSIVRSGKGLPLERRRGFKYTHLASAFKGRMSEPFLVVAKYDEDAQHLEIPLAQHEGEEFDYVLKGTLKVEVAGYVDFLYPGDAIYYNSSEPHGMIAAGGENCEFIAVVTDAFGKAYDYHGGETESKIKRIAPATKEKFVYSNFIEPVEDKNGKLSKIEFKHEDSFNFAYDVVDAIAKKSPDKLAMLHVDKNKNERRFTFGDMSRLSSKAANYLSSIGVKKGDRVMLVLKRHYQFWISILACHKLGAVVVPATNLLMKKDYDYRFKNAGISTILCTADGDVTHQVDLSLAEYDGMKNKIVVGGDREGWRSFDREIVAYSGVFPRSEDTPCGNDNMLMFFTSGTTGYPKIAMHSYTYPLGHYITAQYWHNVYPSGLHFTIADTGWGKALWGKLYGQWLCEGAVFTYDFDKFDAHDILPMFKKYNITTFCAPPTMFRFFIKEDLSKYDLSSLRYATVAGEALNPEVYQQFLNATGVKLMEGFGQTETTLVIANLIGMTPKPGSMGLPSPLYDVDLVDEHGNRVKTGETGEIVIRIKENSPNCGLFLGYYNNQAADKIDRALTGAVRHDGLYHTGDTAWRDEDGYFWYVGRTDDLIKSSGYRIGPFEIESVLMELPYVLECAVTAAPDAVRGQVVKATVVLTRGKVGDEALKREIQSYVKTHTAPYKYPRIVEFVEELPKTISGKIRRVDIRNKEK